jgi:FAD/FMN-containing dehydrogenase
MRGEVIGPANSAYDRARVVYNERYDGIRPLAVARPLDAADVQAVVRWGRQYDVRLAVRSGGHSYGGYSTGSGVVVDLRHLARVSLASTGTATIGAGARLIDVYSTLAARGRSIPAGSCPTVGIGGLALGGGVGLSSRAHGTTSDNVVSLRIVTADGRLLVCDAKQNADLFWACRGGGGGSFGVVVDLALRTFPIGGGGSYFFVEWPWSQAEEAVAAWERYAPAAPDPLFSLCQLRTGGTGPVVSAFGQYLGPESALRRLLPKLAQGTGPASTTTGSSPYLGLVLRFAGCLGRTPAECHLRGETPEGLLPRALFAAKSDYVAKPLPAGALSTLRRWIERRQSQGIGSGSILLDSYAGALNRVPAAATAFVHRDQLFSAQYLAYWGSGLAEAGSLAWLRGFHAAMRPYVSGFAYQNYIDPELDGWKHAYYGANLPRLVSVKRSVDPDDFFRFARSIPTSL